MQVMIIGVDPGSNTGMATFTNGKLILLETVSPIVMVAIIKLRRPDRVIFEDSRLTSFMFTTVKSRPAALKMARNVGEIDAWCKLIDAVCEEFGIISHGISPKGKGAKLDAAKFNALTGWGGDSNQHTRDAAMIAWPYRRAA